MFPIRDSVGYRGAALITRLLIISNVLVFFWQITGGTRAFQLKVFEYGFIPALFFAEPLSEAFRLLTSMFMHGGVSHIVGNMWFLWVFGASLEQRLGEIGRASCRERGERSVVAGAEEQGSKARRGE